MNERYEIRRKIGQGGLGTVYQAFDSQLRRDVAIKRLFASVDAAGNVDREAAAEKLMREATALSRLNHPNIVSVFDVGVDADGGYVVMELLQGETLTETIGKGTLTLADFHQVVIQTLEALIAAEAANMLHRDLKPSNIMLNWLPSGRFLIKVLDFGLAKVSTQPSLQTIDQNNSVLGSIFYMAPEQFERRELRFATDIYSMGCIYYFCLTGRDPFTGRSVADVMNAHLEHRVAALHEIRPELPRPVCDWVMWLLRRDMDARPQTAKEALDSFPISESGGAIQVVPEQEFKIPAPRLPAAARTPSSPEAAGSTPPASSTPRPQPSGTSGPVPTRSVTSGTRLPASRTSGPVPSRNTAGVRLPPSSTSGPIATHSTTGTRLPSSSSGPVPSRTGLAPTHSPSQPSRGRLGLTLGVGGALLSLVAVLLLVPNVRQRLTGQSGAHDNSVASLTSLSRISVAEGDEIQFSFAVRFRSEAPFRFSLIQPDKVFQGYTFDLEEHQPVSLTIRRYAGESATTVREVAAPKHPALNTKLEGRNITASQVAKAEVRAKMTRPKELSFTVTLWNTTGEKGVYTAKDTAADLTSVQEYGFRGLRAVLDQVGDRKFSVAKVPGKPSTPKAPAIGPVISDPSAMGLTVLLDDNFDAGSSATPGNDADLPLDGDWQDKPYLVKPDPAKKVSTINGTTALAMNSGHGAYTNFPSIELKEGRLIEAAFRCRIDDSIDSLRLIFVNKTTESRGYLIEINRNARIAIHEFRGQHAKDFPLEVCRQIHEMGAPGFNPRLSQLNRFRLLVSRLKDDQARVQVFVDFSGGKSANTGFTDALAPAPRQFATFGLRTRGKKGRVLIDDVQIVSSAAPK